MKKIIISLIFISLLIGVSSGQTKSMTGTVNERLVGNRGTWAAVVISVGTKRYYVVTESMEYPTAKTSGTIDKVGRKVRVFFKKIDIGTDGYDGEIIATKIVEIKKSKLRRKK